MQHRTQIVIYRPGREIGIGHLLVCWSAYQALALQLAGRFLTTISGTIFESAPPETASNFVCRNFRTTSAERPDISLDHAAIARVLAPEKTAQARCVIIGRNDNAQRAKQEFPGLASADLLDRHDDQDKIVPSYLANYDIIYVDSVRPQARLTQVLGYFRPDLALAPIHNARAAELTPGPPYIAVHLRHGNGEQLSGRPEGGSDSFHQNMRHLAQTAKEEIEVVGARGIVCLSDNAEAAAFMAAQCGGQTLGAGEDLPDAPFQAFMRAAGDARASRFDRMFLDLAVLASAQSIIAGASQFANAAKLLGRDKRLQIVSPDGARYMVLDKDIGNKFRDGS